MWDKDKRGKSVTKEKGTERETSRKKYFMLKAVTKPKKKKKSPVQCSFIGAYKISY